MFSTGATQNQPDCGLMSPDLGPEAGAAGSVVNSKRALPEEEKSARTFARPIRCEGEWWTDPGKDRKFMRSFGGGTLTPQENAENGGDREGSLGGRR